MKTRGFLKKNHPLNIALIFQYSCIQYSTDLWQTAFLPTYRWSAAHRFTSTTQGGLRQTVFLPPHRVVCGRPLLIIIHFRLKYLPPPTATFQSVSGSWPQFFCNRMGGTVFHAKFHRSSSLRIVN